MLIYQKKRFFWRRAGKLDGVLAVDLARLWKAQRGCCAISGDRLNRDAQIDHIVPLCKGGTDKLENLQWVTANVNYAKRGLTQGELISLCKRISKRNQ